MLPAQQQDRLLWECAGMLHISHNHTNLNQHLRDSSHSTVLQLVHLPHMLVYCNHTRAEVSSHPHLLL